MCRAIFNEYNSSESLVEIEQGSNATITDY